MRTTFIKSCNKEKIIINMYKLSLIHETGCDVEISQSNPIPILKWYFFQK